MYTVFTPIARYTRFVWLGKRALWVLAGLFTLLLLLVAWLNSRDEAARITLSHTSETNASSPEPSVMSMPRYQGVDDQNRPFTITAERARQLDRNTVEMTKINADILLKDAVWASMTSGAGKYTMSNKYLFLNEGVSLFYEGGYEFRSPTADIDINAGTVEGGVIEGQGPAGILKADSFKLLDRGEVLRFNGHVYVKLYR